MTLQLGQMSWQTHWLRFGTTDNNLKSEIVSVFQKTLLWWLALTADLGVGGVSNAQNCRWIRNLPHAHSWSKSSDKRQDISIMGFFRLSDEIIRGFVTGFWLVDSPKDCHCSRASCPIGFENFVTCDEMCDKTFAIFVKGLFRSPDEIIGFNTDRAVSHISASWPFVPKNATWEEMLEVIPQQCSRAGDLRQDNSFDRISPP